MEFLVPRSTGMTVMVIPVSQHKLIKIRKHNRDKLTRAALYCSTAGALCNVLGSSTNSWISTSEVLKYYMAPNATEYLKDYDAFGNQPVYIKEATLGPWQFCWSDPSIEFTCHSVNYFTDEMESDVTTMVQQAVRKAAFFMVLGVVLDILGTLIGWLCSRRKNPYGWLLCSSILHIFAGMTNFCCIIVYMAAVSKEVGNKIYPASEMDDPLFHYHYGFSFILVKLSFLLTETAALLMVVFGDGTKPKPALARQHLPTPEQALRLQQLWPIDTQVFYSLHACNQPANEQGGTGTLCSPPSTQPPIPGRR
ncbi:unnamed protein product, partial [Mesorhabditis spiculigera]